MRLSEILYTAYSLLLVALMSIQSHAQTYANLPTFVQSASSGADAFEMPIATPSGNLVWGGAAWDNFSGTDMTAITGLTDNCSNTYTLNSAVSLGSGHGADNHLQTFYTTASSTCKITSMTFTPNITPNHIAYELVDLGANMAVDGSSTQTTYSANPSTISGTVTTSQNSGLVVSFGSGINNEAGIVAASPSHGIAGATGQMPAILAVMNAGAAGSYTATHDVSSFYQYWMFGAQAIKPTTHFIANYALPNAGTSTSWNAQLYEVGGSSSPTWSATAGTWPTGCSNSSVNSSTGAISCTPTLAGTYSITFSDGTASKSLSFQVVTLGPISVRNFVTNTVGHTWSLSGVSAGDLLVVCGQMMLSSSGGVYEEPLSNLSDTCGSTWRLASIAGGGSDGAGSPGICYAGKAISSCGADLITLNTTGPGSPVGSAAFDIANAQIWIDPWAEASGGVNGLVSNTITTPTYTPQEANEQLLCFAGSGANASGTTSWACQSPFTLITNSSNTLVPSAETWGGLLDSATSGLTASAVVTNPPSGVYDAFIALLGLRPDANTAHTFAGEKRKRRVY